MDEPVTTDIQEIAAATPETPSEEVVPPPTDAAQPDNTPEAETTLLPETTQPIISSEVTATAVPTSNPDVSEPDNSFVLYALLIGAALLLVIIAVVIVLLIRKKTPAAKPAARTAKPTSRPSAAAARPAAPAVQPASPAAQSVSPAVKHEANVPVSSLPNTAPLNACAHTPGYHLGYAETIGKRSQQEDSRGASNPQNTQVLSRLGLLAVVADGIGGIGDGQVASDTAVRAMLSAFEKQDPNMPAPDRLLHLAALAQNSVSAISQRSGKRMGCTLVSVLVHNEGLSFLSVGDSRICLLRSGVLLTLNREHVLGREHDEHVALGETNEAMDHKHRVRITSYIGIKNLTLIDRNLRPLRLMPGDKILLMSDGVFNVLSEEELIACMRAPAMAAAQQTIQAVEKKNYPGQDNATILVVEYS